MAKAKKGAGAGTTALVQYDAEFAKYAKDVASHLTVGGSFISLKAGRIAIGGKPVDGNKLRLIIIDNLHVNAYYDHPFDEEDKSPPNCFAIGREESEMEAHPNARAQWQNPQVVGQDEKGKDIIKSPCATCPQNVMGSNDRGKGKACGNTERLAVISAEDLTEQSIKNGEVLYIKLSVMNRKPFALYAKGLNEGFRRPPFGVITVFSAVPDVKSQFKTIFEMEGMVPKELSGAVIARHEAEMPNTGFPWTAAGAENDGEPKKKGKGKVKKDDKKTKGDGEGRKRKLR